MAIGGICGEGCWRGAPRLVVAVSRANKMARVAWAVIVRRQVYRQAAPG